MATIAAIALLLGVGVEMAKLAARPAASRAWPAAAQPAALEAAYLALAQAPPGSVRVAAVMERMHAEQAFLRASLRDARWPPTSRAQLGRSAARLSGMAGLLRVGAGPVLSPGVARERWEAAANAVAAEADGFGRALASPSITRESARASLGRVDASCVACHDVFVPR